MPETSIGQPNIDPPKIPLMEKSEKELKLYHFIANIPPNIGVNTPPVQQVIAVLSYDLDRAFAKAITLVPQGTNLAFAGAKPFSELLNQLDLPAIQIIETPSPPFSLSEMNFENFKSSLMLTADKLIKDERDRTELKKIINNLKFKKVEFKNKKQNENPKN